MKSLLSFLFRPVHASSLAFIRIAVGLVIFKEFITYHAYFSESLIHSKFLFTYDGFHWVGMFPQPWLDLYFYLMYLAAGLFVLGLRYRLNAILLFLGYSYLFLLDKGHYNNHYYLYCLFLFLFAITDAHKWGSLDAWLKKEKDSKIPNWQVAVFQIQLLVVYFFGGIAKIHGDWFKGFPLRFWLYDNSYDFPDWIGQVLRTEFIALFFSYGGFVFDLFIGFLLLYRPTRYLALIPLVFFHVSNHFLWNIGTFPLVMLLTTSIFFDKDWFKRLVRFFRIRPMANIRRKFKGNPFRKIVSFFSPFNKKATTPLYQFKSLLGFRKAASLVFLAIWFSFQIGWPLRHFFYPGHPSWTGEGHLFAWRMMLVDTVDAVKMKVKIPETGEEFYIAWEEYINWRQFRKMLRTPKSYLHFAHYIRDELKEKGGVAAPEVYFEVWKSVNERPPKLLNDTTLNYAVVPYTTIRPMAWLTEWKESEEVPVFNNDNLLHWREFAQRESQLDPSAPE